MSQSITIAVTSYNRGKYLDALLTSLKDECTEHRVIVIDNASSESRVKTVIEKHSPWISDVVFRTEQDWINDEYIAKNIAIERNDNDIILFLQDDLQFVGPPGSIATHASALRSSGFLCLTANGVRRSTINNTLANRFSIHNNIKMWPYRDGHFHTMGFFKAQTFQQVGPYPIQWPQQKEFWGRSEDVYDKLVKHHYATELTSAQAHVPIFLPVWNDPRGGYAFLRDNKRYGHYTVPQDSSGLYYAKMTQDQWNVKNSYLNPQSFIDVARPLGWSVAVGNDGDQFKYPQSSVLIEGPVSGVDE